MRAVLANLNFRRLWIAQLLLALGDEVMQLGLLELFRAHQLDERAETAKLFFAVSLPGLILGPVAIAYLDRWQRRGVMMVSDALRAVCVAGILVWLLPLMAGPITQRNLLPVYLIIGCIGSIATVYLPAPSAVFAHLGEVRQLVEANTVVAANLAVTTLGRR